MYHFDYVTENTCSQIISMDLDGNIVKNVRFLGGCPGNLKAISTLVDGWTVEQIEEKLQGITCGRKPTSCGDQLARAVRTAYEAQQREQAQSFGER
ncbi:MAG: TIGR03905 family TSCPD domain-containing protein [Parasporobacterium sp.]|nr:TIGR03905 family TSCPD domain-containing protein [Parasporobacterium sp.]